MVNFTTVIYQFHNLQENTLTCDLKNYMTPDTKIDRRIPVEKVLYWLSKYDRNRMMYRRISDKL